MLAGFGEWITLEEAEARGLDLAYVAEGIGPRRAGMVTWGAYWQTVNSILAVHVRVGHGRDENGRPLSYADAWQVTERDTESPRPRAHCTSWTYDRGNKVLHGPADMRPGRGWRG